MLTTMTKINLLARYDKELRIHIMYPEARREVNKDIVRFVRQMSGLNFVGFTFANEIELDRVIDQQLEYFARMNQPFTWKVYDHDLLPSLKTRLASRNFIEDEAGDIMVLNINEAPSYLFQPARMWADIRRIVDRENLKDVVYVLDKVYGDDNTWVYNRLGSYLKIPGYLSVYVGYVEHQPASVAWMYFPKGHFATLHGGSTLVEQRGKGLYTSLLSVMLKELRARGYPFAVVEARAMTKPIVAKHGFQRLTTVWDYVWKRN